MVKFTKNNLQKENQPMKSFLNFDFSKFHKNINKIALYDDLLVHQNEKQRWYSDCSLIRNLHWD